jgi:hypothetical protein
LIVMLTVVLPVPALAAPVAVVLSVAITVTL